MREWIDGLGLWAAIAFFWAGAVLRSSTIYGLGWAAAAGGTRAGGRVRRLQEGPLFRKAEGFVNRWGVLAVPACFLTVGFQTAVLLVTGLTRMPLVRWIPAMLVGTFVWGCIYGTVGMAVVWAWLQRPWIAVVVVLAVGLVLVTYRWGSRARSAGGTPEDPGSTDGAGPDGEVGRL